MKLRLHRLAGVIAAGALLINSAGTTLASGAGSLTLAVADTTVGPTSATGNAHVRVVHGSPDAPEVDVYAGATLGTATKVAALSGLSFGQVSAYANIPAGTYAIKVCATADASVCPIQVSSLTLAAEAYYTIAASNALASIEATVFTDTPAPGGNGAQLRVYHLSADTPSVDVLTSTGADISPALDNLPYKNASGYLTLPAGTYDVKVCAHADHTICPLGPIALTVAADHTYSIFAVGSLAQLVAGETATPGAGATPPASSTAPASGSTGDPGLPLAAMLLLTIVFVTCLLATRRLATVRNRR